MKTIIKNPLFITVILFGCLSLTSCHQNDTITTDVKLPRKNRPANNLNADLFGTINFADIPDIEDDFDDLVADVHNTALTSMLSYLESDEYTVFSNTEMDTDSIINALGKQCAYEIALAYNLDTMGYYVIMNASGTDLNEFLINDASSDLVQALYALDTLSNLGNVDAFIELYGLAENLTDDKERLIYKTCLAVAQQSYNYWSTSVYDAFSFLPEDLLTQYHEPENPPLFYDNMREINWQNVAKADGRGAKEGVVYALIEEGILLLVGGTLTWADIALKVGVHAAVHSIKAYILESENCTIEIVNTNHSCFEDSNSCLYRYIEDKYQLYGHEYLINNWNGRFYFMLNNF